jgi:hypothetical protein
MRLTGPPDAVDGRGLLIIFSNNLFDFLRSNSPGGERSGTPIQSTRSGLTEERGGAGGASDDDDDDDVGLNDCKLFDFRGVGHASFCPLGGILCGSGIVTMPKERGVMGRRLIVGGGGLLSEPTDDADDADDGRKDSSLSMSLSLSYSLPLSLSLSLIGGFSASNLSLGTTDVVEEVG